MRDPNLIVLETMVNQVGDLVDHLVFVGGSTVGLYISDKAVPTVRHTIDIDCVVEVVTKADYYKIAERLREKGFNEDLNSNVICRFRKDDLILDVMPTDEGILSFTNAWYAEGIRHKISYTLPNNIAISIFSAPFFLASKLEAFKGRGKSDFMGSHDIEDVITIFDGDSEISKKIQSSPESVRNYLKAEFNTLLKTDEFTESIEGHINDRHNTASRANVVLARIRQSIQ